MRVRYTYLILILLLWAAAGYASPAAPSKVAALLQEANLLKEEAKDNQALAKYEEVLEEQPTCFEALWKACYLQNRIGHRYNDENSKLLAFQKAWKFADAALCANPEDANANYVMALSVYNRSLVLGMKERMLRTKDVKYFLDQALCADPKHGEAWQLLGRWNYKNANLTLAERTAARLFFGGVPLDASNEMALEALQNAIKYNPENISSYYDLATVYLEMQKTDLCLVTLHEAVDLKLRTSEELYISRRCKALLERLEKT